MSCCKFFATAHTGLLLFFVSNCPMSVPWHVGLLVSTAKGTPYQTVGMHLVYARVFPSILLSTISIQFLALF